EPNDAQRHRSRLGLAALGEVIGRGQGDAVTQLVDRDLVVLVEEDGSIPFGSPLECFLQLAHVLAFRRDGEDQSTEGPQLHGDAARIGSKDRGDLRVADSLHDGRLYRRGPGVARRAPALGRRAGHLPWTWYSRVPAVIRATASRRPQVNGSWSSRKPTRSTTSVEVPPMRNDEVTRSPRW